MIETNFEMPPNFRLNSANFSIYLYTNSFFPSVSFRALKTSTHKFSEHYVQIPAKTSPLNKYFESTTQTIFCTTPKLPKHFRFLRICSNFIFIFPHTTPSSLCNVVIELQRVSLSETILPNEDFQILPNF